MARRKNVTKPLIVIIVMLVVLASSFVLKFVFSDSNALFEKVGLRAETTASENVMYVNFLDVGQGDCTLIVCGDTAILVDGGEKGMAQTVCNYIRNSNVEDIDCMIATHPHSDHIGSLSEIMTEFEVKNLIMPEIPKNIIPTTATYKNFLKTVSGKVINIIPAQAGNTYSYGEVSVSILAPNNEYEDLNDMSVVTKITYGETSVMLTGDAGKDSENDIIKKNYDCKSDLLKIGHHGSRTSTSDKWLNTVKPEFAVISCGLNNDYGHPHKELLNRLEKHNVEYYRTDIIGNVVFKSDGKTITKVA